VRQAQVSSARPKRSNHGSVEMPITTIVLAGMLSVFPKALVPLTVDFVQVTTGIDYRIDIKLFDSKGLQKGKTQSPIVGAAASNDDIIDLFQTDLSNLGLTSTTIVGTKKVEIMGARVDFGRIEYSTFTKQGDKWIPNDKIKGPTLVGKPGIHSPSFA
jgi:hypothetical protein